MLATEKIFIKENERQLYHVLISIIVLILHNGLWTYLSEYPTITVDRILDATESFFGFDKLRRLIHDFGGYKTSCPYTDREFNLIERLSDFDEYLIKL